MGATWASKRAEERPRSWKIQRWCKMKPDWQMGQTRIRRYTLGSTKGTSTVCWHAQIFTLQRSFWLQAKQWVLVANTSSHWGRQVYETPRSRKTRAQRKGRKFRWKEIQAFSLQLDSTNNQLGTCEKDTYQNLISTRPQATWMPVKGWKALLQYRGGTSLWRSLIYTTEVF